MTINRLVSLLKKAKRILQTEGLISLIKKGFTFLRVCSFSYGTYYCYEHTLKERDEADFLPKLYDITLKIIVSKEEADKLVSSGFDFGSYFSTIKDWLDKGAIVFCIFVGRELAHIGYACLTEEAHKNLEPPYRVNFINNEVSTGGTITIPKYRGNGLMTYGEFKKCQFLKSKGITTDRYAVATSNLVPQRVMAKFSPKIYAKAYYLKVLGWRFWKEKPLVGS